VEGFAGALLSAALRAHRPHRPRARASGGPGGSPAKTRVPTCPSRPRRPRRLPRRRRSAAAPPRRAAAPAGHRTRPSAPRPAGARPGPPVAAPRRARWRACRTVGAARGRAVRRGRRRRRQCRRLPLGPRPEHCGGGAAGRCSRRGSSCLERGCSWAQRPLDFGGVPPSCTRPPAYQRHRSRCPIGLQPKLCLGLRLAGGGVDPADERGHPGPGVPGHRLEMRQGVLVGAQVCPLRAFRGVVFGSWGGSFGGGCGGPRSVLRRERGSVSRLCGSRHSLLQGLCKRFEARFRRRKVPAALPAPPSSLAGATASTSGPRFPAI
jgi:hypothetical protein